MGATPLMSLGMRAMAANYAALQVTGHNIANASVAGYSRQRVELATAQGQFSGAGFFGKGSDVVTITRNHNAFLTREAMTTTGLAAKDQARLEQLRKLETVFPTGEQGLGHATLNFLNAFSDLSNLPADMSSRQVVLARAQELAARFADAGAQVDQMQHLLREDLKTTVQAVNELTGNIAKINQQIAEIRGLGQPPNDLLDARDRLLTELSSKIAISTVHAEDGTVGVFAGGGQRLVLGKEAQPLAVVDSLGDPSRAAVAVMDNGVPLRLDEGSLGAGRIAGLLQFQNQDLVDAQLLLGQMAAAVGGAVNAQQKLGLTLHQPAGSVPAQDMFSLGAPVAQPMGTNRKDPGGRYIGQVELSIVEPSQLQASEYDLRADPANPGAWQLTRLSDGVVRSVRPGDVVDGFRVDAGSPPPLADDKFLLQPVTRAAPNMTARLTDPRDIAAASALTATVGTGNTGTARIGALTMTSDTVNPQLTASITFTDASGAYSWELRDRATNALMSSGTGTWTPGSPIPSAPDPEINGFALTLEGVPAAGDTVNVGMTTNVAASNGNALALAALRDQAIVGVVRQANGSLTGGASATDAYAAAMADIGVRVQGADAISEISRALATQAEQTRSSEVGVNLDEEAAMLISYQQSYQAAAKVLQIAQSVFDTLLSAAGAWIGATAMTMRVSTQNTFERGLSTLQRRQAEMAELQEQMTSGKRVTKASDDPAAAARAERALATKTRTEADQRALDASRNVTLQAESALGDANELLQQVREQVLSAGNASYTDQERLGLAQVIRGLREQMLSVANRGDGAGGYLFGGQGSNQSPFVDAPGGVAFRGDGGALRTANGQPLPLSVDGGRAWLQAPDPDTGADTLSAFDLLDRIATELETPGRGDDAISQTVRDGVRGLDAVMNHLGAVRSNLGEALNRADAVEVRLSQQALMASADRSAAEDLDMVQAVSDFQNQQTGYDAALKAYAMVQRLSLFDYVSG